MRPLLSHLASLLLVSILSLQVARADSPLTSTPFSEMYQDVKMVKRAAKKGVLDKKIALYIMDDNVRMDEKAAVANALGWNFEGKENGALLLGFLVEEYGSEDAVRKEASASELMCVGYLMAMDNYFEPARGMEWLDLACGRKEASFTTRMIRALVASQIAFDADWCKVFTVVNEVAQEDPDLWDMRGEAVEVIMEYIRLYEAECK